MTLELEIAARHAPKESDHWKSELGRERFASKEEYLEIKRRYWDAIRRETGEQKNPVGFWHG